jgi:hypothetical protein
MIREVKNDSALADGQLTKGLYIMTVFATVGLSVQNSAESQLATVNIQLVSRIPQLATSCHFGHHMNNLFKSRNGRVTLLRAIAKLLLKIQS